MSTTARRLVANLAAMLFATILFTLSPTAHAASPLTITAVAAAHDFTVAGNTVTLSNGVTLFCPIRPFNDGGRAPQVGQPVLDFVDQGSFMGWYYGYATFTVAGTPYIGYRR